MYTCETAARVTVGTPAPTGLCSDPNMQGVCSDPSQVAAFDCDEMDAFVGCESRKNMQHTQECCFEDSKEEAEG